MNLTVLNLLGNPEFLEGRFLIRVRSGVLLV